MYDLVSFVSRGRIRTEILKLLDKPMTPTELSSKVKTHRPTISRSIQDLENKGLVECITPNERMGRYYRITALGKRILEKMNK